MTPTQTARLQLRHRIIRMWPTSLTNDVALRMNAETGIEIARCRALLAATTDVTPGEEFEISQAIDRRTAITEHMESLLAMLTSADLQHDPEKTAHSIRECAWLIATRSKK